MDRKKKVFFKNTVMLYILQFSTYVFSFATVPYQTRVLGPAVYGYLGVAAALMAYFQLVMDFGFLLSATQDVSQNRLDKAKLNRIYTSVNVIKAALALLSFGAMFLICWLVPKYHGNLLLYVLYFAAFAVNAFLPDYLYRGLEEMQSITYRTVAVKALFTVLVFVFIKGPEDYLLVPVLLGIGNVIAVVWAHIHVHKKLGIRFTSEGLGNEVKVQTKRSAFFFLSRIATTVFTTTNTVILGAGSAFNDTMTGFYNAADRLITTGRNCVSPLSDSAYPYMIKNKDFKLVKKILLIFEPLIVVFCIGVFIFADPLCGLLFGKDFITLGAGVDYTTGDILRAMLPIGVFTLPNYILGFPTLGALGYNKEVNWSIIAGTVIHLINLAVLFGFNIVNAFTLAILTSVAEGIILLFRIAVLLIHRKDIAKLQQG